MTQLTVSQLYQRANLKMYDDGSLDFNKDVEIAFEFAHLPDKVKSKIHSIAWEEGHSAGYYDVVTQYFDLVELAKLCYQNGVSK